ncbi:hypothetical protein [Sphingosinicella sp.]|uniref:hypothetical protein n=1 Tax=Sphingosinicella sp. TaxID=1917971 RepID=UPI004037D041
MADKPSTYTRTESGSFMPVDAEHPIASEVKVGSVYLRYEVRQWSIVSSLSVIPDKAPAREQFDLHDARPPRTELRLKLDNESDRLRSIREEGTASLRGAFPFMICGNNSGAVEGFLRHAPAWSSADDREDHPEAIHGGASIPQDQFDWILAELAKPDARLHLNLIAPLFKEAIAHSFDVPGMYQEIYIPYDEGVHLKSLTLTVVHGTEVLPAPEMDEDAYLDDPEPKEPLLRQASMPAPDPRLTWIVILLVALIAAVLFRR